MIFNEQPENFVPSLEVVSCLVECDNKILLLLRQDHKMHGGKWDPPAGKVDKTDKDKEEAMLRELREETGIMKDREDLVFIKTFLWN